MQNYENTKNINNKQCIFRYIIMKTQKNKYYYMQYHNNAFLDT